MVNFAIPENNQTIFASSYKLYLPIKKEVQKGTQKELEKNFKTN